MSNRETGPSPASQDRDAEQRPGQTAPGSGGGHGRGVFVADTIRDLDGMLGWLDDAETYHRAQLERVKQDQEAVQRVRLLHLQRQAESTAGERGGIGAHSHVSPCDIVHCTSIKEAYTEIACRSGGLLRYHTAAGLLLAAGFSKSKSATLLAQDLRRRLEADANWEHHSPGVYKYLPYTEGGVGWGRSHSISSSTIHVRPSPVYGNGAGGPN